MIREAIQRYAGVPELREQLNVTQKQLHETQQNSAAIEGSYRFLQESMYELERELAQEGWQAMGRQMDAELSRQGLRALSTLARIMFLRNPLINRAVVLQSIYVWAQGCSIAAEDDATQALIDEFWTDPQNQAEFTGHQARTMKDQDLQVYGNLFFVLFSDVSTGGVKLSSIPFDEVEDIVANPENRREPWYYKRRWNAEVLDLASGVKTTMAMEAWYPDWRYEPADRPDMIGGKPVHWDAPVFHVRVGGLSDMRFGVSEIYQAIDWARAVTRFLENWAKIVASYARFAFNLTAQGGAQGVAAAKAALHTGISSQSGYDTNPPPQTGATWIGTGESKMEPIRTSGATTSAEDVRPIKLMVCAATGLPETMFGDVSVGTLATAKSLDRPTELKFRDRQELWKSIIVQISQYVVSRSRGAANGRLRGADTAAKITCTFPPILVDVAEQIAAWRTLTTLDGQAPAGSLPLEEFTRQALAVMGMPSEQIEALVAKVEEIEREPEVDPALASAADDLKKAVEAFTEAMKVAA